MTPNRELIVDVFAHIELDPSSWNQASWATAPDRSRRVDDPAGSPPAETECGTAYCFAGWACVLSGEPIAWERDDNGSLRRRWFGHEVESGVSISRQAEALLGIRRWVDGGPLDLFDGDNSLDTLYRLAAKTSGIPEGELRLEARERVDVLRRRMVKRREKVLAKAERLAAKAATARTEADRLAVLVNA